MLILRYKYYGNWIKCLTSRYTGADHNVFSAFRHSFVRPVTLMLDFTKMCTPELIQLMERVKARKFNRHNTDKQTQGKINKFEKQFSQHDVLWYWLEMIIYNPKDETESIIDRMGKNPWESSDNEISLLWENITRPEMIPSLIARTKLPNLNPYILTMTQKALSIARSRKI